MGLRVYLEVTVPCTAAPSGEPLARPRGGEPDPGRQDACHPGELPAISASALPFRAISSYPRTPASQSGADGPERSGGAVDHVDVSVLGVPEPERDFERRGGSGPVVGSAPAVAGPGLDGGAARGCPRRNPPQSLVPGIRDDQCAIEPEQSHLRQQSCSSSGAVGEAE